MRPHTRQISAVRLSGITLRGIYSYGSPARLDLARMTVLCGPNGSGKSSWMNALGLVRYWSENGLFPFWYAPPRQSYWHSYLNNSLADIGTSPEDDTAYGLPGTIGLIMDITPGFSFSAGERLPTGHDVASAFFSLGDSSEEQTVSLFLNCASWETGRFPYEDTTHEDAFVQCLEVRCRKQRLVFKMGCWPLDQPDAKVPGMPNVPEEYVMASPGFGLRAFELWGSASIMTDEEAGQELILLRNMGSA